MAKEEQKIPGSWQQVRTAYPKWAHPFIWIEWVTEWIVYGLSRWAFIDLLQLIAALSIVWVAFDYVLSADERQRLQEDQRKAKHYQAWQVINSARGQSGSGGRIDALEDLSRDGVSLAAVDLSDAWLRDIRLPRANLMAVGFKSAILIGADLSGSNLFGANLQRANLANANLRDAVLVGADLSDALLMGADLSGAKLTGAKLDGAALTFANLQDAYLVRASLEGALVSYANLQSADLSAANLRAANLDGAILQATTVKDVLNWKEIKSLTGTRIFGLKDAPAEFQHWAVDTMKAIVGSAPYYGWEEFRRSLKIELLMQRPEIAGKKTSAPAP